MKPRRSRKPSGQEITETVAAAWLVQREEGLTADEQADFDRWCRADPRHAAAVARLEKTWADLQQLRGFRPEARKHPDQDLLSTPVRRPGRWLPPLLAATAFALVLAAWLWRSDRMPTATAPLAWPVHVYATTDDGYQRVTLEDGSVMELNARSEVRVEYTPTERGVRLIAGEAHFTVVKHQSRPFLVRVGAVAVRAVGTEFNVRLADRQVEVLVNEGRVKVEPHQQTTPATADIPTLAAGQRVLVPSALATAAQSGPAVVDKLSADVIRELLAWQGPRLVFVDEPLRQVVEQFNRVNRVQIVLADPELGSLAVAGGFRAENVEAFVRLLTTGNEIAAEHPDPNHVVLRKVR